jgi:hypothetical protein
MYTLAVIVNQSYERRTAERSREVVTRLGRSFWNDVAHKSSWLYIVGTAVLMLPNMTILIELLSPILNRSIAVAGMGICFSFWTYRYVRGFQQDPENPRRQRRMHSATAGALFVTPIVISLVTYGPGSRDVLGAVSPLVGRTGVAGIVVLSVVIRGHERKPHGVYRGQTRWLAENPDAMDAVLPSRPNLL